MLRTPHPGGGEAVSEFDAPHPWNSKYRMGDHAFHAVPERFAKAYRQALHGAGHYASQGIAIGLGGLEGFGPGGGIGEASHFGEAGVEAGEVHHLFGNDAGGHKAQREPAAEHAATPQVIEASEFQVGREVGVARTGVLPELLVVFAAGVLVAEQDGEGSAGGIAIVHAGKNFGKVFFHPGCGS